MYSLSNTGVLKWTYATGSSVESTAVIGPDGTVYIGSNDSYVYAFSPTGDLLWQYATGGYAL